MSDQQETWITLACIVRPQGRRGEVLADLFTDFPELFTTSKTLSLAAPDETRVALTVESLWLPTGRSRGRVVLKLLGTDSISAAELLKGYKVQMLEDERVGLEDKTYYVSDLVGCELLDGDTVLGTVTDVHFPVASDGRRLQDSAPLFVLTRKDGNEVLIPFANAFVQRIDLGSKQILMKLPAGLVDVNG